MISHSPNLWTRRRFLAAATATPLALFALSACSDDVERPATSSGQQDRISFQDLAGRTIALPRPAERIVTLVVSDAAMVIAAHGSPAKLVGIHPRANEMFANSFMGELFPEVLKLPTNVVTGEFAPNVEGIARLSPDVVVQRDNLTAPLENAGMTVARYRALAEGADATLSAMLVMCGEMIGDITRAQRLNELRAATLRRLSERLGSVAAEKRASALILTCSGGANYASGGDASGVYSYMIYRAGGINSAERLPDYSPVSVEQIAAWNPDVIFLFNSKGVAPEVVLNDPILRSCKAAAQRRVYTLPTGGHNWGSLGPEDALMVSWMAELLYPERLERALRSEMRQTYEAMLDRQFDDARLNQILLTNTNGASANYGRFLR